MHLISEEKMNQTNKRTNEKEDEIEREGKDKNSNPKIGRVTDRLLFCLSANDPRFIISLTHTRKENERKRVATTRENAYLFVIQLLYNCILVFVHRRRTVASQSASAKNCISTAKRARSARHSPQRRRRRRRVRCVKNVRT